MRMCSGQAWIHHPQWLHVWMKYCSAIAQGGRQGVLRVENRLPNKWNSSVINCISITSYFLCIPTLCMPVPPPGIDLNQTRSSFVSERPGRQGISYFSTVSLTSSPVSSSQLYVFSSGAGSRFLKTIASTTPITAPKKCDSNEMPGSDGKIPQIMLP